MVSCQIKIRYNFFRNYIVILYLFKFLFFSPPIFLEVKCRYRAFRLKVIYFHFPSTLLMYCFLSWPPCWHSFVI